MEGHGIDGGAAFAPELVLDGLDGALEGEADVGGEGLQIGMCYAEQYGFVSFDLLQLRRHFCLL